MFQVMSALLPTVIKGIKATLQCRVNHDDAESSISYVFFCRFAVVTRRRWGSPLSYAAPFKSFIEGGDLPKPVLSKNHKFFNSGAAEETQKRVGGPLVWTYFPKVNDDAQDVSKRGIEHGVPDLVPNPESAHNVDIADDGRRMPNLQRRRTKIPVHLYWTPLIMLHPP